VKPGRLLLGAAVGLGALLAVNFAAAYTANLPVQGGRLGFNSQAAAASQFEPPECTGSVTSIAVVPAGGGPFTVSTGKTLILGSSGNDNVVMSSGYACFVGGGPAATNLDAFSGALGGGDQCVVATSNAGAAITNCTIVARRP
jgi:hypothetical protein